MVDVAMILIRASEQLLTPKAMLACQYAMVLAGTEHPLLLNSSSYGAAGLSETRALSSSIQVTSHRTMHCVHHERSADIPLLWRLFGTWKAGMNRFTVSMDRITATAESLRSK